MNDKSMTGKHAAPPPGPESQSNKRPKREDTARQPIEREAVQPGAITPEEQGEKILRSRRVRRSILGGIVLAAMCLLILAMSMRGALAERRIREQLRRAEDCCAVGDYENALGYLRQLNAVQPDEQLQLRMVDCYEAMGAYDKALELLRGMDTRKESIRYWIDKLTNAREQQRREGLVSIAGQEHEKEGNTLVIRARTLSEEDLKQISSLYSLNSLTLSSTGLSDLSALSGLSGLTMLDLSGNAIVEIQPLSGLIGLRSLYLDDNPITDFSPLYALGNLNMLSIRNVEISQEQLTALSEALPHCVIHSEVAVAEVRELSIGGMTFRQDVSELDLSERELSDLSVLAECKELQRLDLRGNQIKDLTALMDLPKLEWLNLSGNEIEDLRPLMAMRSLQSLNLEENEFHSISALSALSGLKELYLSGNELEDLNALSGMSALDTLTLAGMALEDRDLAVLEELKTLKSLDLRDNPALTGDAVDALKRSLRGCKVEHSRLVYTVEIDGERYRKDLTELDLSGRGYPIPLNDFWEFSLLEKLNLSGNQQTNIYNLQQLKELRELDLSDNALSDLTALASLNKLEILKLSNNRIQSVTALLNLKNLKYLDVRGNALTDEQINQLKNTLKNCEILYDEVE